MPLQKEQSENKCTETENGGVVTREEVAGGEEEGEVGQAGRLRVVSEAAEQVWTL